MENIIANLNNKIIVSVQAAPGEPLYEESALSAMMKSVVNGGAKGLRLAGARDVKNAKMFFDLPVVGLTKPDKLPENWQEVVYITPSITDAKGLIDAGADIIAADATFRPRNNGETLDDLINYIHDAGKLMMADIATHEEGLSAASMGADIVSTTLSGYTKESLNDSEEPDFELLEKLLKNLKCPVFAEGRFWTPEQVRHAFSLGAHSVVIGSAITRPQLITKRFIELSK